MIVDTNDLSIPAMGTTIDEPLWKQFWLSLGTHVTDVQVVFYTNTKGERDVAMSYGLHNRPAPPLATVLYNQLTKGSS